MKEVLRVEKRFLVEVFGRGYEIQLEKKGTFFGVEVKFFYPHRSRGLRDVVEMHFIGEEGDLKGFVTHIRPFISKCFQRSHALGNRTILLFHKCFTMYSLELFRSKTTPLTSLSYKYIFSQESDEDSVGMFSVKKGKTKDENLNKTYNLRNRLSFLKQSGLIKDLYSNLVADIDDGKMIKENLKLEFSISKFYLYQHRGKKTLAANVVSVDDIFNEYKKKKKTFSIHSHPTFPKSDFFVDHLLKNGGQLIKSPSNKGFLEINDSSGLSEKRNRLYLRLRVMPGGDLEVYDIWTNKTKSKVIDFVYSRDPFSKRFSMGHHKKLDSSMIDEQMRSYFRKIRFQDRKIICPKSERFKGKFWRVAVNERLVKYKNVVICIQDYVQEDGIERRECYIHPSERDLLFLLENFTETNFSNSIHRLNSVSEEVVILIREISKLRRELISTREIVEQYDFVRIGSFQKAKKGKDLGLEVSEIRFGNFRSVKENGPPSVFYETEKLERFKDGEIRLKINPNEFVLSFFQHWRIRGSFQIIEQIWYCLDGFLYLELLDFIMFNSIPIPSESKVSLNWNGFIKSEEFKRIGIFSKSRFIAIRMERNVLAEYMKKNQFIGNMEYDQVRRRVKFRDIKMYSKEIDSYRVMWSVEWKNLFESLTEEKRFEIMGLVGTGYYILDDFDTKLLKIIQEMDFLPVVMACTSIRNTLPHHKHLRKEFKRNRKSKLRTNEDLKKKSLHLVKHVHVRPFSFSVVGHLIQISNEVVRNYPDPTPFIVVEFKDFKEIVGGSWMNKKLSENMKNALTDGIRVLDYLYRFVGVSGSGMKAGKSWFVRSEHVSPKRNPREINKPIFTPEEVRKYIGNLDHIKVPAKHLSRISMAFSSTIPSIPLSKDEYIVERDITKIYRGREVEFTEGCGLISHSAALEICKMLSYQPKDSTFPLVSAFQIRFGGCKGVLVVDNEWKYGKDIKVAFNESQVKFFSSTTRTLNIINLAEYHPSFTNRQMILLSTNLGLDDDFFEEMAEDVLVKIDESERRNKDIIQQFGGIVKHLAPLYDSKYRQYVESDEFLQKVAIECSLNLMMSMADYQRIPSEKGCLLMGVYDYTRSLKENEVYVCPAQKKEDEPEVLVGTVLVGKNPCHFPGDLRVLQAVRNPRLQHLRNVIMFSVQSKYPDALKMSGGDLDGDLYTCVKLTEKQAKSLSQKEFYFGPEAGENPTKKENGVSSLDLVNFFVEQIYHDNVGKMSNAHLVCADLLGVEDPLTLDIAELCRVSVDYPTSGIHVTIDKEMKSRIKLKTEDIVPEYFTNNPKNKTRSGTGLGKIYQSLSVRLSSLRGGDATLESWKENDEEDEEDEGEEEEDKPEKLNRMFVMEGWKDYSEKVESIYRLYKSFLISTIKRFRLKDEFELMAHCRILRSKDYFQLTVAILRCRDMFDEIALGNAGEKIVNKKREIFKKLSCAYVLCYSDGGRKERQYRILSFPWVMGGKNWIPFFKSLNKSDGNQ